MINIKISNTALFSKFKIYTQLSLGGETKGGEIESQREGERWGGSPKERERENDGGGQALEGWGRGLWGCGGGAGGTEPTHCPFLPGTETF